ncbi:hemerythrin domain-containing protein [Ramlibacter sp. PS3R-8]|uniref:hemerythrin domain-containing protein n=1 Tax=Ramlibacter sp. PS3R-8 TaxID=3133437 RepID=UPI0030B64CEE
MSQHDDATVLLDEDHNEVIRMFEQYKSAKDPARQKVLARQICQELLVHMQIEEEIFYPAYIKATGDRENLKDGLEEHQEARELIRKLEQAPVDARLMLELEDGILHHVNDEREKMFPKARKTQGMDLMALAQQLQARKMELMAGQDA